ncbi:hypothetical protein [Haematobacter missouriensis]|nr:hypothetical protein [Haematobacter missouriensis]
MNYRQSEIATLLGEWLDRYTAPIHLRDKANAAQKEVEALLRALLKFAPQVDYQPFCRAVFDQLDFQMKTRAWPTVGEMGAVCSNIRKESPRPRDLTPQRDTASLAIIGRRMAAGEAVGESYLYDSNACDLIAGGHVDAETMRRYRKGAFMARRDAYGHEKAVEWEREQIQRHEEARQSFRDRERSRRDTKGPDKSTPVPEGYGDWDAA